MFPGSVEEAEASWYDTGRWHVWVDGLERVSVVEGDWPRAGAEVRWESGPAGRGRVRERVLEHEPLAGQTLEVQDGSIRGRQRVTFTARGDRVLVELTLEYRLERRTLLTPLLDALFIRRAIAASLRSTLARFGSELASARADRRVA